MAKLGRPLEASTLGANSSAESISHMMSSNSKWGHLNSSLPKTFRREKISTRGLAALASIDTSLVLTRPVHFRTSRRIQPQDDTSGMPRPSERGKMISTASVEERNEMCPRLMHPPSVPTDQ